MNVKYEKSDQGQMSLKIAPNMDELTNSIVGTDLVIEYAGLIDNREYINTGPVILRFYGGGDALEYYLQ